MNGNSIQQGIEKGQQWLLKSPWPIEQIITGKQVAVQDHYAVNFERY